MSSNDELFLLSLDLGTSTIKAGVFDRHGREITIASEEYLVIPEGETTVELPAEVFWEVSCRVIHRALAQAPAVARHIAGVSISLAGLSDLPCSPVMPALRKRHTSWQSASARSGCCSRLANRM